MTRYPKLVKREHTVHGSDWLTNPYKIQLRQELSAADRLEKGRLRQIASDTGIKYKTLETWRSKLRADPDYIPEHGHKGVPRKLTQEEEQLVAEKIREMDQRQEFVPRARVSAMLQDEGRKRDPNFVAGRSLTDGFMGRSHLSMREPHPKRRTDPKDKEVAEFLEDVEIIKAGFPEDMRFNVDETCWRVVNGRLKTCTETGTDEVIVRTKVDIEKTRVTVIAGCSWSGQKLPLWLLANGLTEDCEKRLTNSQKLRHYLNSNKLVVDHTPRGWSTQDLMTRYLDWLKKRCKDRQFTVIWDCHSSHNGAMIRAYAQDLGVRLAFIPTGQTGEWQPLDRRVFGSLKMRSVRVFHEQMITRNLDEYDLEDAIQVLVRCWDEISEEEIQEAWSVLE